MTQPSNPPVFADTPYIQRYRFLTIDQFTRAASMKRPAASEQLRELERHGILGHFGNIGMPGVGKTPKVYFLKRKGWELLTRESGIPLELIGTHKETHVEARWSPQMFHRQQFSFWPVGGSGRPLRSGCGDDC